MIKSGSKREPRETREIMEEGGEKDKSTLDGVK